MGQADRRRPTWLALVLSLSSAWGCNALIGASDPTLRAEEATAGLDAGEGDALVASDAASDGTEDRSVTSTDAASDAQLVAELDAPPDSVVDAQLDAGGDGAVADATPDATADATATEAGCGDTSSDVHNCGACGRDCTKLPNVSASGLVCSSGHCSYQCAAGHADCAAAGGGCATDLSVSPNCGTCGVTCPSGTPVCAPSTANPGAYACTTGCPSTAPTLCSGSCVDLTSDDHNCATCGMQCPSGEHCMGSSCRCAAPNHVCGTACVANDDSACGASCASCSAAAPTGGTATCNGTTCVQACTVSSDSICSNVCVDETTNGNCGACGTTCSGSTPYCANKACVQCTGTQTQCASTGNTPQSCVNDQWTDQTACSGTTPVCLNGGCVACTNGDTQCNGALTVVQGCSGNQWITQTTCAAGQICRSAACINAVHDVGWDTALSGSYSLSANFLTLLRLPPLANNGKLVAFGAVGNSATGVNAQMVLYADNGSGTAPAGAALADTSASLILSNMNVQQNANPSGYALSAGTVYWLGIVVQSSTTICEQVDSAEVGTGFGNTFGTVPWPSGTSGLSKSGVDLAIYISVQDTN